MRTIRACILSLIATLTATHYAAPQQKPPAQPTPAQLQQQIEGLRSKLSEAELRAKSASLDTDYISRVQKQYESYYKEVLSTQLWSLGILTAMILGLATLATVFSFRIFNDRTQSAIHEATSQLRAEFATATTQLRTETAVTLGTEVESLKKANADDMRQLKEELVLKMETLDTGVENRVGFLVAFVAAGVLVLSSPSKPEGALVACRQAIKCYKLQIGKGKAFGVADGTTVVSTMLSILTLGDEVGFPERVRNELRNNHQMYMGLDQELTNAMLQHPILLPILQEWREGRLNPTSQSS